MACTLVLHAPQPSSQEDLQHTGAAGGCAVQSILGAVCSPSLDQITGGRSLVDSDCVKRWTPYGATASAIPPT